MKQEYFEIGQIVNTFGIKGMVRVNPFTDDISQFENMETILVDKKGSFQEIATRYLLYRRFTWTFCLYRRRRISWKSG